MHERTIRLKQNTTIKRHRRIALLRGVAYGVAWSVAPTILSELLRQPGEAATVIFAGAITGVLVACVLAPALARSQLWQAVLLGVAALPLGAGLFGIIISWVHWIVMQTTGVHYRFVMEVVEPPGYVFGPLKAGRDYAFHSTCSAFAFLLVPFALLTTLHLRRRILREHKPTSKD